MITVTVGEGESAVVRKFPLFVDQAGFRNGWDVRFTPFAPRFNPVTGGTVTPQLTYVKQDGSAVSGFTLDYRRNPFWYNVNGTGKEGSPAQSGCILDLWKNYYASINGTVNTSAVNPISWYAGNNAIKGILGKNLHYLDQETFSVVVNPGMYMFGDVPGDGVVVGTMQCNVDGIDPVNKSGAEVFPLIVWLDPTK